LLDVIWNYPAVSFSTEYRTCFCLSLTTCCDTYKEGDT